MRIAITHATALAPDPALLTEPERAVLATLRGPRRRDEWIRGRVALHRLLGPDVSVLPDASGAPRARKSAPPPASASRSTGGGGSEGTENSCVLADPSGAPNTWDSRAAESRSTDADIRSGPVRTEASWFEHRGMEGRDDRFTEATSLPSAPLCSSVMPMRAAGSSLASASSLFGPAVEAGCVSVSHDGEWFAVAVADSNVGIDLCSRVHATRIAKILAWLGVGGDPIEPVSAWAALEAVLKLRRLGIEELRGRLLELRAREPGVSENRTRPGLPSAGIVVVGIGEPAMVQLRCEDDYVIAWATESSDPITAQFHSSLAPMEAT
jgi:hypothetical protein